MKIVYRFSDGGYNKLKPTFVTKRGILQHFMKRFEQHEVYVIADNISEETYAFLLRFVDKSRIFQTSLGNALSFVYAMDYAMTKFQPDDVVYFAEDDYIYRKCAPQIIEEGITQGHYVSGYDHPDKYMNHSDGGPNPYVQNGGEDTRVTKTQSCHWKITNSCCMTFAAKVSTLMEDYEIIRKHCDGEHTRSFPMFIELCQTKKHHVVSCIPSVSTHGETMWLAPFVDWTREFYESLPDGTIPNAI